MKLVYGPVPSRRLGRSLGVNLTPFKTCTYNCVYCQLGRTTQMTAKRQDFFPPEDIIDEIYSVINEVKVKKIDFVTFVGEGEPTLYKNLGWLIKTVKEQWDMPVAVDTNGSLFYKKDVRKDLKKADIVMPSLDAGTAGIFKRINRPIKGIEFESVIEGLEQFRKEFNGQLWLEVMLVKDINDSENELKAIKKHINRITPDRIYINVPIRPPSVVWAVPPENHKIELAHEILGEVFEIVNREEGDFSVQEYKSPFEAVEAIVRRHPMREEQVLKVLKKFNGIDVDETLLKLKNSKKIKITEYEGAKFWSSMDK